MAKISNGILNNKSLISSMCFNKLLTFRLAILNPFNLATLCNDGSELPDVGSCQKAANDEDFRALELLLAGMLAALGAVLADAVETENPSAIGDPSYA